MSDHNKITEYIVLHLGILFILVILRVTKPNRFLLETCISSLHDFIHVLWVNSFDKAEIRQTVTIHSITGGIILHTQINSLYSSNY